MRDGAVRMLSAFKYSAQAVDVARSLLLSNASISAFITELQRRKSRDVSAHEGVPCG